MANLEEILQKSREYAKRGYELASESVEAISDSLDEEQHKMWQAERDLQQVFRGRDTNVIQEQKNSLREWKQTVWELHDKVKEQAKSEAPFTILVYGRTEVGKSTLMEVLTHGDGSSIGKGGQRTTRDVRSYDWKGMRVIDVPGIASFDGREDDEIAEGEVEKADLILFLISDDGVQEKEAEHLASLRKIGKPVLGLINVKVGVGEQPRPLELRRIAKKMGEKERIEAICQQFRSYDKNFQQDWSNITFMPTHLKAAYLGQDKNKELWQLSNFDCVEQYITDKVAKDGCFLRIKTYIDMVANPLRLRLDKIIENSTKFLNEGLVYRHKCNDLLAWRKDFIDSTQQDFYNFQGRLLRKVQAGIADFAETHYEDQNADKHWETYIKNELDLPGDCERFINDVAHKWERKKRELLDDFQQEIRYSGVNLDMGNISMDEVTDWQFGATIASAIAAFFSGPIGIGLFVLSRFFDSKSERIAKQKSQLRNALSEAMEPALDKIGDKVLEILNDKVLHEGIDELTTALDTRDDLLMGLSEAETDVAGSISDKLQALNLTLWQEGCKYLHLPEHNIYIIARIPGEVLIYGNSQFTHKEIVDLKELLSDRIVYRFKNNHDESMDDILEKAQESFAMDTIHYNQNGEDRIIFVVQDEYEENNSQNPKLALLEQIFPMPLLR